VIGEQLVFKRLSTNDMLLNIFDVKTRALSLAAVDLR
jgi:hypothetical protein